METVLTRDFLTAVDGKINDPSCLPSHIHQISLDSRQTTPGNVYWAIPGKIHDGHQFVESALNQGAAACVVDHAFPHWKNHQAIIHVENTLDALQRFARWYRSRFSLISIGITGSYGKTTTRELLHSVLAVKKSGIQNQHNYNNEIGVPLTVLNLLPAHQYMIVEMGAAKPNDIHPLAEITSPQVGLITGIGPAHLGGFKSVDQIVRTKGDLIAALPREGFAVIPGEKPWTKELCKRAACRVLTVGPGRENNYSASEVEAHIDEIRFKTDGFQYRLRIGGRHHVTTALIAIATAKELGYSPGDIQQGFDRFQPVAGRGKVVQQFPWTVIDDTYNANPASCRAACELLAAWKTKGKRLLVLGEMLDLGDQTEFYHEELGEIIARSGIEVLLTFGQQEESIRRGIQKVRGSKSEVSSFHELQPLLDALGQRIRENDVILVKGSRGMRMERVLPSIARDEPALQGASAA